MQLRSRPHHCGNLLATAIAYSKLTAQGQISVSTEIQRRLGIRPGSLLEWEQEGEKIVVRRAGRYSSEDVHRAADVVEAALQHFRAWPKLGFSDCLILEVARKAGHLPLGTFDRDLGKLEGTHSL